VTWRERRSAVGRERETWAEGEEEERKEREGEKETEWMGERMVYYIQRHQTPPAGSAFW
jgi:hypothetical protein